MFSTILHLSPLARSEFFDKIFTSGQDFIDEITDVSVDAFKQFLRFLYTDDAEALNNNVQELLKLAVRFEINDLTNICASKLQSQVNDQNAAEFFSFGNRYNLADLKMQAFKVIQKSFRKLNQSLPDDTINEPEKVVEAAGFAMKFAATLKEIKTSVKKDEKSLKKTEGSKVVDGKDEGQEKVEEAEKLEGKIEEVEGKVEEVERKDQEVEAQKQEEKSEEKVLKEAEAKETSEVRDECGEENGLKEVQETSEAAGENDVDDPESDRDVVIESIQEEPPIAITEQTPDDKNIPEASAENSQDKKKKKNNKKREAKKNARGDTEVSSKEESTTDNE